MTSLDTDVDILNEFVAEHSVETFTVDTSGDMEFCAKCCTVFRNEPVIEVGGRRMCSDCAIAEGDRRCRVECLECKRIGNYEPERR